MTLLSDLILRAIREAGGPLNCKAIQARVNAYGIAPNRYDFDTVGVTCLTMVKEGRLLKLGKKNPTYALSSMALIPDCETCGAELFKQGHKSSCTTGKPLNHMARGMWPLNWASAVVKEANDVMFSLAVNDRLSAESRIAAIREYLDELEKVISETCQPAAIG